MSEELKPCPFCGGEAQLVPRFCMGYIGDGVRCKKCCAETPPMEVDEDAIKLWNRRADKEEVQ